MTKQEIDLNADLGESFGQWKMGNDERLLDIVTSANIACGFHAGDPDIMARTIELALAKNVSIGAHPGFDDLRGFGRRRILGDNESAIRASIIYQISALSGLARVQNANVTHVKLHGAMSNMASEDPAFASICLQSIKDVLPDCPVFVPTETQLHKLAHRLNMPVVREIFADRAYCDDGTLVPRSSRGAVLTDPAEISDRALRMLEEQKIVSINSVEIPMQPDSICVHGDSEGSLAIAEAVRERLEKAGMQIRAFSGS